MASALLWLACDEVPRSEDEDPRREESTSQALQDLAAGQWSLTSPLATARAQHTATLLPDGKVLVAGGLGSNNGFLASAEVYDPATGTWSATNNSLGTARAQHTATLLPDGKVLIAGGLGSNNGFLANAEVYDPATGNWSPTGSLARGRFQHTATLLPDGKVLVAGGLGSNNSFLASAEVYDPATGRWSATNNSLGTARAQHTATLLPTGKVLITGGLSLFGPLNSAALYDPGTGRWNSTGSLAAGRFQHTATRLPTGKVLVTGGSNLNGPLDSAALYDPATGSWSATGSLAARRSLHAAVLLPAGKVLATGGLSTAGFIASAEVYDESGASTRPIIEPLPPQRPDASFIVRGSGFMNASGGPGIVRLHLSPEGSLRDLPATDFSDASMQITLPGVPEGYHLLFVLVDGVAGGQFVRVDGTPPGVPGVSLPGDFVNTQRPAMGGTAEAGSTVTVWLDGAVVSTVVADETGLWRFTPATVLAEGLHLAEATATDAAGNVSPLSQARSFTVDSVPPDAPVLTVPGVLVNTQRPAMAGTAEAGSTITVSLDGTVAGTAVADEAGLWHFSPATALTEGLHLAEATAKDAAGNISRPSQARSFTVDTVPPDAPVLTVPGVLVKTWRPAIGGTAEAGSTVTVWLDGTAVSTVVADEAGLWRFIPAMTLTEGSHVAMATATDAAGNTSPPSAEYPLVIPRSHEGWGCATTPYLPTAWALLLLAWSLGRRCRAR